MNEEIIVAYNYIYDVLFYPTYQKYKNEIYTDPYYKDDNIVITTDMEHYINLKSCLENKEYEKINCQHDILCDLHFIMLYNFNIHYSGGEWIEATSEKLEYNHEEKILLIPVINTAKYVVISNSIYKTYDKRDIVNDISIIIQKLEQLKNTHFQEKYIIPLKNYMYEIKDQNNTITALENKITMISNNLNVERNNRNVNAIKNLTEIVNFEKQKKTKIEEKKNTSIINSSKLIDKIYHQRIIDNIHGEQEHVYLKYNEFYNLISLIYCKMYKKKDEQLKDSIQMMSSLLITLNKIYNDRCFKLVREYLHVYSTEDLIPIIDLFATIIIFCINYELNEYEAYHNILSDNDLKLFIETLEYTNTQKNVDFNNIKTVHNYLPEFDNFSLNLNILNEFKVAGDQFYKNDIKKIAHDAILNQKLTQIK